MYYMFGSQTRVSRERAMLSRKIKNLKNITLNDLLASLIVIPASMGSLPREDKVARKAKKKQLKKQQMANMSAEKEINTITNFEAPDKMISRYANTFTAMKGRMVQVL